MKRAPHRPTRRRQRGASLLLMVIIAALIFFGLFTIRSPVSLRTEQGGVTADALAQAKAALIGYAATYKETHSGELAGYLPCPDTNNDGIPDTPCGLKDVSVVGRLPWKELGLPPLRDGDGECLWYAVTGRAKNNPKTDVYNWDTPGQFIVQTPTGQILAGATPHARPLAVIFAAGRPTSGQNRGAGTSECPGTAADAAATYLEGVGALGSGNTTITVADADTLRNGTNNDRAIWITSADIFGAIKKRSDFKTDVDAMLSNVANYLNTLTPLALPATSSSSKGVGSPIAPVTAGSVAASYLGSGPSPYSTEFFKNWSNTLLYTKLGSPVKVNGETGCYAVLAFGGERAPAQSRDPVAPSTEADTTSNYLEAPLLGVFGTTSDYSGPTDYFSTSPTADLVRCIKGITPPATQTSFATNFGNFGTAGAAGAAVADSATQSLDLLDASGTTGGCFWFADPIPLAGRTIRSYYTFKFATADDPAIAPDLRYGFTLQMVRGDVGIPLGCGSEYNSGALPSSNAWGDRSLIVETDIFQSLSRNDPPGNHTAIMKNGSIDHATFGVLSSTACNGTVNLCQHTPADTFEESPTPLTHNQRMEIITGCNPGCGTCTPALHADPNTYAKMSVWVDCLNCSDVAVAMDRVAQPPTVQICSDLNPSGETALNQVYVGFTGGISSTYPNPVTIRDFVLRSE